MRRGYAGEYRVKNKLKIMYEDALIIKTAIRQEAPDYTIIRHPGNRIEPWHNWASCLVRGVEVKSTKKNKYYPKKHDVDQWMFLKDWISKKGIPVEYWVLTKEKGMVQCEIMSHEDFGKKYIKGVE